MNTTPLTITVLGSGTSAGVPMIGCLCPICTSTDPRDQRSRPSIALHYKDSSGTDRHILVDTTPELRLQSRANSLHRIDAVIFTHAHADHIFGLDDLRRYNTVLNGPLPLYAAPDTMQTLQTVFAYAFKPHNPQLKDALFRPNLQPHLIDGPFSLFDKTWTPIPLIHGRFNVLGFRIDNFAYCTDCNEIPPASRALLQNLDTLIIDGLRPTPHPTHLSFEQALAIIADLKPKRAFFTHLSHDIKHADLEPTLPTHVKPSYDGLRIEL
ncbi:MAG TPA: MBL fold metallo-hydrolase [Phycisphaerae bacterium]|nr:MBL fold metallo-hydrolase [Phycisphaerae bacterium]